MKSYIFVFIPNGATPEDFRARLRDSFASIPEESQPTSTATPAASADEPQPFWTWFVDNPRPRPGQDTTYEDRH